MAKVESALSLLKEIEKKFKGEAHKIVDLLETLEENPRKGKFVGQIEGIIIKEIKYRSFRFYFVTDGFKLKFLDLEELSDLLIKFIRMSDKKDQQKVIDEIKKTLRKLGKGAFE